ncbi:hypothetical protein HDF23_005881 [Mucilaginibacter lappiensis]|uniref:Glycosyl transferase family 2 n=2 Tax=Mucilaginibacter lappiensis TaxID=354630 RepID=A0ABR6PU37_9SPHI|nr:hypothetical protein [Mucilaginibacter lappiensis]
MNRLHHLKQTLPQNIKDNIHYKEVEFLILDYHSSDGLQEWIFTCYPDLISSGTIKFYRTEEPDYFLRSHSRNMAFNNASGDVLCNIDADNFTGPAFADYINDFFAANENCFITPAYTSRDVMGRLVVSKKDFLKVRGYNEQLEGYGYDDVEIYKRLETNHLRHAYINDNRYLSVIHHSHVERYENEYLAQNVVKMMICYLQPDRSRLCYFYKDGRYECGEIMDPSVMSYEAGQGGDDIVLDGDWEEGLWKQEKHSITMVKANRSTEWIRNQLQNSYSDGQSVFFEITEQELSDQVVLIRTEIANRKIFTDNLKRTKFQIINPDGYGKGHVKRCYDSE